MRGFLINFALVAVILAALAVGFTTLTNTAGAGSSCDDQECFRKAATAIRNSAFDRARKQVPVSNITNFPARRLLNEFTRRQSLGHHPWYVYQMGMNGNVIRYFVSKQFPVNTCDYLETTESINWNENGNVITHLPPFTGVYQSGNDQCNTYVFQDQITDAMVTAPINTVNISERPIIFHERPVKVKVVKG